MPNRANFLRELSRLNLNQTEEAIALLWFYRQTQAFEERSASELSADFRDEGYSAPNATRLGNGLSRNRRTVTGRRRGTFQINSRYLDELDAAYGALMVNIPARSASPLILPEDFGRGTRHLEQLVIETNGSYEHGYYDACAVMLRRILESLIISVFVSRQQADLIRVDGNFLSLEALILKASTFDQLNLARDARRIMGQIKEIGDVAAHNRNYLTRQQDIDDVKLGARRILDELLQAVVT
jgi:hypothetical protein